MKNATLLRTGIIGSADAAMCCLTPALVLLVGALGLSAIVGDLDHVLVPAFGVFLAITAYALYQRRRAAPATRE